MHKHLDEFFLKKTISKEVLSRWPKASITDSKVAIGLGRYTLVWELSPNLFLQISVIKYLEPSSNNKIYLTIQGGYDSSKPYQENYLNDYVPEHLDCMTCYERNGTNCIVPIFQHVHSLSSPLPLEEEMSKAFNDFLRGVSYDLGAIRRFLLIESDITKRLMEKVLGGANEL